MSSPTPELKSKMVRAGAGAGKTTGLVAQVQSVYQEFHRTSGRDPRIVVTTFTRKATQELKERLIRKACDDRDSNFLRFVTDPGRLQISTIHGLLSLFLKQTGHLADLDSGFQILSESEAYTLARRALRETLLVHPDGFKWFETYEFERALHMCRAYDRVEQEHGQLRPATVEDMRLLAEPMQREWSARLRELAQSVLEELDDEKWTEFAQGLLGFLKQWPGISIEDLPKKPTKQGAKQKALEEWHLRTESLLKDFKKLFEKAAWDFSKWPEMESTWAAFQGFAEEFSRQLSKLKDSQGRFEMNDLELLTHRILTERPFLAAVFADNWDYWMIDEFQDTSPIQAQCLWRLIGEKPRYLVGDPQQSIYLFRGADVSVFTNTEAELKKSGSEVDERLVNYRSEPALLHFINDFMNTVSDRFVPMSPGLKAGDHSVVCEFRRAADPALELEAVVSRIGELVAAGAPLQNICVLGRTHAHLFDVAVELRKHGYPTHLHASSGFHERREVQDAQALWTFLFNPHDTHNLVALLRSPWFFVEDQKIGAWLSDRPTSLWRTIAGQPEVAKLHEAHQSVREIGAVRTFEKILVECGALDLCLQFDPAGRKESNLWKLVDKARRLESEGTRNLLDLSDSGLVFDALEMSEGDATSAQEPNCINLMTVHAAKGLEFDHVVIPRAGHGLPNRKAGDFGFLDGLFYFPLRDSDGERIPSLMDLKQAERDGALESAEFNRALYVAATRAKKTLTFTWSRLDKDSWASRSEWFQLPVGDHQRGEYTFCVREEWASPTAYSGRNTASNPIRAPWAVANVPVPERLSVTEKIAKPLTGPAAEGRLMKRLESRLKGQRIHRRLEALRYGHKVSDTDPAMDYVMGLTAPPMAEILRDGFAEWGFQVKTETGVVEGQIDLWGKVDGRLYVIDYKSGSTESIEQAFLQLEHYGAALRRFGHEEPMTLAVIYPLLGRVEVRDFDDSRLTDIL